MLARAIKRRARVSKLVLVVAICAAAWPTASAAYLSTRNFSPFPASQLVLAARWTSPRYGPPSNQSGDILPTIWADDGNQYAMVDDGGTDVTVQGAVWRQSLAQITGAPPHIQVAHVGDPNAPPPHTYAQIHKNQGLWAGPLGPYYSSGLVEAGQVFYATQQINWRWGINGAFTGLHAIAYSTNHGADWNSSGTSFPAPLGNLSWVIRGQGGVYHDGYVYAIASEREFNASYLILGRSHPDIADMTNPAKWQWQTGWQRFEGQPWPVWSRSLSNAVPMLSWVRHISYPQVAYDSPLKRYLLTFTYSYTDSTPGVWKDGSDLVILEGRHPWGPFSYVVHEANFGPSNGYAPGFPIKWISGNGRDLWLKWSANFDGCAPALDCTGGYGFNYRRLHLTLAGDR